MRSRTKVALGIVVAVPVLAAGGIVGALAAASPPATPGRVVPAAAVPQAATSEAAPAAPDGADTDAALTRVDWTAYHGDVQHTGYAPSVPPAGALSTKWTAALDGVVQASPLALGSRVIAATENNTVYALDRVTGAVVWQQHLGTPVPSTALPCGNITPVVGITGTPVYDPVTRRVFAVTTTRTGGLLRHTLVGLDAVTGAVELRTPIDAAGSDPLVQNQRGALGLSPQTGRVLVPFGGHAGDCGAYHGYLVSVLATDGSARTVFRTGTGTEAGMWQPSGAAVDSQGYAYTVSGNGSATAPPYDGSDSVNRVDPRTGTSVSLFAPAGWAQENAADLDLGSAGVALVGDIAWIQGKTATGYLLHKDALGGVGKPARTVTGACATQFGGPAVHGDSVIAPCTDGLRRIVVRQDATFDLSWRAPSNVIGSPVIGGGRVWSLDPRAGRLYSLDEATGATVASVPVGTTVRFATPALSGRLVLVPTMTGITAVTGA